MEKKSITIELTEEGQHMVIEGFKSFEVLGLLRFYEKTVWLQIQRGIDKHIKETKLKEENKCQIYIPFGNDTSSVCGNCGKNQWEHNG